MYFFNPVVIQLKLSSMYNWSLLFPPRFTAFFRLPENTSVHLLVPNVEEDEKEMFDWQGLEDNLMTIVDDVPERETGKESGKKGKKLFCCNTARIYIELFFP